MNLPHLKEVKESMEWVAQRRAELKETLEYHHDRVGPAEILDVLTEVVQEWGSSTFETAKLQKVLHVDAIRMAADTCRMATRARFAAENVAGYWPVAKLFSEAEEA